MESLPRSSEGGFFLWDTLLAGLFLLFMAGAIGLYARAMTVKSVAGEQATAIFLARAQISYAQYRLEQDASLPAVLPYLGDAQDLVQNGRHYRVESICSTGDDSYQLQVTVSWEVQGRVEKVEFRHVLGRHAPKEAARDRPH